jgi:prepilin-type processing-associated H-X9-DG protein
LIKIDGTGINKNAIKKPDQVGLLCDANFGTHFTATEEHKIFGGGIIGGYSLILPNNGRWGENLSVNPIPRHYHNLNIAFTDGHVATVSNSVYNLNDPDNVSCRAFYRCQILGLIDNPAAGLGGGIDNPFGEFTDREWSRTVIGGDPVTSPIMIAAGEVQKKMAPGFRYKDDGFKGSLSSELHPSDYLEGVATGKAPAIDPQRGSSIQIGIDAMVVIVNKDCAIKVPDIELDLTKKVKEKIIKPEKFWRLITMRNLQTIINSDGYGVLNSAENKHQPANYTATRHDWQLYLQNKYDGTRSAIAMTAGSFYFPGGFGSYYRDGGTRDHKSYVPRTPEATRSSDARTYRGIYCNSDTEIINKVASDPLGIGIVSAAFVDTQKVDILAVDMNTHVRWAATFPIYTVKNYSEVQDKRWPFQRNLYAVCGKTGTASEKISTRIFDKGKIAFFAGPLYKSSYYPLPVKETENNLKPRVGSAPKPPKQSTPQKTQ